MLIPGIMQAEDYARLVLSAEQHPNKIEELLAIRMGRQAILTKADPPWVFLLIRESVIRDLPAEVRSEQCKRLIDANQQPNISVQILPRSSHVFQESGFQVLSFKDSPDVVYVDGAGGHGQLLTDPGDVRGLTVLFNVIRSAALSARESKNLICMIMEADA